jgi:hypothetical protein
VSESDSKRERRASISKSNDALVLAREKAQVVLAFILTFFFAFCGPKTSLLVVRGKFLVLACLSFSVLARSKEIEQVHASTFSLS